MVAKILDGSIVVRACLTLYSGSRVPKRCVNVVYCIVMCGVCLCIRLIQMYVCGSHSIHSPFGLCITHYPST